MDYNGCCIVWWLRWLLALMLLIAPNFPRDCLTLSSVDWAFRPCRAKIWRVKDRNRQHILRLPLAVDRSWPLVAKFAVFWISFGPLINGFRQSVLHHEGLAWCLIKHSCNSFRTGFNASSIIKLNQNYFSKLQGIAARGLFLLTSTVFCDCS